MNKRCINKTDPQKTAEGWKHHEVDLDFIEKWVTKGYGWCACWYVDRYRSEDNTCWKAGTNLVVLDIDGDTTLDAFWATNTARRWCVATYTSHSHSESDHRFRALFPLGKILHSLAEHKGAYYLIVDQLLPELGITKLKDNCGAKPERLWYGNNNAIFQYNSNPLVEVEEFLLNDIAYEEYVFQPSEITELDTQRCQWLLRHFLRPSEDGEYNDYYLPVTAACASIGEAVADDWRDWVLQGHHGSKPSNSRLSKWRNLTKSSYIKLYSLAKEQDAAWHSKLPKELRTKSLKQGKGYQEVDPLPIIKTEGSMDTANFTKTAVAIAEPPQDIPFEEPPANKPSGKGKPARSNDEKCEEEIENVKTVMSIFKNLRLNSLTDKIEYDNDQGKTEIIQGRRFDIMTTELAIEHGVHIVEKKVISAVTYAATKNMYCPIRNYLEMCERAAFPHRDWNRMGTVFLKNDLPIANEALKRLMIGAVARAFDPGCAMSWLPILIGKQGAGKSQFCRSLAPTKLFAEVSTDIPGLIKEPAKLHQSWIIELPEIDYQFQVKNIEPFKNLITTRIDETRKPYARDSEKMARRFVFLGTTNKSALLVDSTGNRRFVPIEIHPSHQVDWRRIESERDMLWCSAVQAYRNGENYEYTSGELEELSLYVKQFADPDPWEEIILDYIKDKEEVKVHDILNGPLDFAQKKLQLTRKESGRVTSILEHHGWRLLKTTRARESVRLWVRPKDQPIDQSHINCDY